MIFSNLQTTSAREVQRNYRGVVEKVKKTKKPVVVLGRNQPEIAIIDLDTLEDYVEFQKRQEFLTLLQAVWERNKDLDPDEVYNDLTEDVEAVRQEMYERQKAKGRS